ncbi:MULTISPECIES: hypothetical protein [Aeromonas]|uniref:hypothetical protein n=1 Tax=Aeromonas TaxID=642 RepID=UPI0011B0552C|nr:MULTISPECIES: hypothetical protein [Aeromonas]MBJ7592255.1 hypothetical protein [Aeromonas veronii]MDF8327161.1 hypothetical protein [Aeromonas salmonicida]MDK3166563.1 hypothetical protein [Aeromonas caviae]HDN9017044.1 hypothetical protein [Aeromonas salmonicida]
MFGYEQIHQYSSNSDGCRLLSPVSSALAIAIASHYRITVIANVLLRGQRSAALPLVELRVALVVTLFSDVTGMVFAAQAVLAYVKISLTTSLPVMSDRGITRIIFSGVIAKIAIAGELAQIQVTGKVARLLFKGDAATAWDKSILQEVTIHALFALFAVPTSHAVFP